MTDRDLIDGGKLDEMLRAWCAAGILNATQADRIRAHESARWENVGFRRGQPATHTSLIALFADVRAFVRAHPGASVLASDDPWTRSLGWTASKLEGEVEHSVHFTIGIVDLKRALANLPPDAPLRSELLSAQGRQGIAQRLADPASELL
jgi:hypothetical protein